MPVAKPPLTWSQRIQRLLEPPRKLRPTRVGWFFVLGAIAVGGAAVNTGNNLLYFVMGMMLGAIVVSGILSERNLNGLRVERAAPPDVTAGVPAILSYVVTARRTWLPILSLTVQDYPAKKGDSPALFVRVDPGQTRRRTYERVFPVRGVHALEEVEAGTAFPFGLFRKSRRLDAPGEVRVRPRVTDVDLDALIGGGDDGESRRLLRGDGLELFGLRDHVPGDEARRIHWKATARAGRAIVKDPAKDEPPAVVVRLALSGYASAPAFERAVERAASLSAALLREGFGVGLMAGELSIPASAAATQLDRILDALVDVAPGDDPVGALPPQFAVVPVGPGSVGGRERDGAAKAVPA